MPIIKRQEVYNLVNKINLNVFHFAKGTYPEANGNFSKLPFNRFFIPIADRGNEKSYIRDEKNTFFIDVGKVYFIPLHHIAAVYLTPELHFISIQFTLEFSKGIDIFSRISQNKCFYDENLQQRVIAAFELENKYAAAAALQSVTSELASKLIEQMNSEQINSLTDFAEFQTVINHITTHCNARTTIDELAAIYGSTRENFSRRFSAFFNISPKQYLNNAITAKAAQMMFKSSILNKEIADHLGFANEFYFSRFFKKNTGYSPKNFKILHHICK